MKTSDPSAKGKSVPVALFLEAGRKELGLALVAGRSGLKRHHITEATINRPGLALSGCFKHFAYRRIQVLGLAEHAYLSSLGDVDRDRRLRDFFSSKIPCVVVARGKKVFPEVIRLAEEFRVPVLKTRMVTKHFVNAATILMENVMAPRIKVQGTMVEIMGVGVLIEGGPGIGKSDTALGLIRKGYALVSDDVTALRLDSSGAVIGAPVSITRYHMEIRGLGIIHVPSLFGVASVREEKKLDLVVTLCQPAQTDEEYRGGGTRKTRQLLGMQIPQVVLAVRPGRDLANLVETAALDMRLKLLGHDAEKELDEKLMLAMTGGGHGSE